MEPDEPRLLSEIDTPAMQARVLRAAVHRLGGARRDYQADYEHGQWWLTRRRTGAQWSVVTCRTAEGPTGVDYLDFESITDGEEE